MRTLLLVGVLIGCGDDAPTPSSDLAVPRVAIDGTPTAAAPGDAIPLHLTITGDASAAELIVFATAPGDRGEPDPPRFVQSGVAPATGSRYYLATDGWSDTEVVFASPATTGDLSLVLPTADAGDWAITALLRSQDGGALAVAGRRVLVSAVPAVSVSIDRFWASPDDAVTAVARFARAGRTDLDMVAWLTLPTGEQIALPASGPSYRPIVDDDIELLHRTLSAHGPGDYRLAVRLVDAATGAELSAGGAGFTVCAAPGNATGTVRDAAGNALAGGEVSFTSLDRFDTLTAEIGADGTFATDLPVGSWVVAASTSDAHEVPAGAIQIGCAGPTTVDLVADPPVASAVVAPRVHAKPAEPPPRVCSPLPKIRMIALGAQNGGLDVGPPIDLGEAKSLTDYVAQTIRHDTRPDVEMLRVEEMVGLLESSRRNQLAGNDATGLTEAVGDALANNDFVLAVKLGKRGNGDVNVIIEIYDWNTAQPIPGLRVTTHAPIDNVLDAIEVVLPGYTSGLVAKLRALTDSPQHAILELSADQNQPVRGAPFQLTVTMTDLDTCRAAPAGRQIVFSESANIPPLIGGANASQPTTAAGIATVGVTPPGTATGGRFRAVFTRRGVPYKSNELALVFQTQGDLHLTSDKVRLAPAETATATAVFTGHPSTKLSLTADGGTVDRDTITTDADGRANFRFTAGPVARLARVVVEPLTPLRAAGTSQDLGFFVEAPLTVTLIASPRPAALVNQTIALTARALLASGDPAPGIPVLFTIVSGSGTLSTLRADTDDHGDAVVAFTAPSQPAITHVRAVASLDAASATDEIDLVTTASCPNCPVTVSGGGEVPKGGTVKFTADQPVSWSTPDGGGTITSAGVFTAGTAGGEYRVFATSVENPTIKGLGGVLVDCAANELGAAHATPPFDGGGKSYAVTQTIQFLNATNQPCQTAPANGSATIKLYLSNATDPLRADVLYQMSADCDDTFGFGDNFNPPRLTGCTIAQDVLVSGCLVESITVSAVGPGIAGLTGHYQRAFFDGATATCIPQIETTFTP